MNKPIRYTLKKEERLKSRKLIGSLFEEGKSIKLPSFVLLYLPKELETDFQVQTCFTVSKRLYKRAVDRNRIKRLMKESFRKEKHRLYNRLKNDKQQLAVMIMYTGRTMPNQSYVDGKISMLLHRLRKEYSNP